MRKFVRMYGWIGVSYSFTEKLLNEFGCGSTLRWLIVRYIQPIGYYTFHRDIATGSKLKRVDPRGATSPSYMLKAVR